MSTSLSLAQTLALLLQTWSPSLDFSTTVELCCGDESLKFTFTPHATKSKITNCLSTRLADVQHSHRLGQTTLLEYLQQSAEVWEAAREEGVEVELGIARDI